MVCRSVLRWVRSLTAGYLTQALPCFLLLCSWHGISQMTVWGEIPNNIVQIIFQWFCSVYPPSLWMQPWSTFVLRRNCPFGSLAQSNAALQAPGSCQENQRWMEGRRDNPSFVPQPRLARKVAGAAGRVLCSPSSQPVCHRLLGSQAGLDQACTSSFSLVEGGELCLKGSIPDRRLLLKPCSLSKLLYLWFHSTAFIVVVIRVMFYPIFSKLISYLCMHQRVYEHQAFVAKIQLGKTGSECRIKQLNIVDQWDKWVLD